jgi:hypothetical protein
VRRLSAVVLLVGLAAGCSDADGSGGEGDIGALGDMVPAPLADELTESGRCDDGRLWASDDGASLVVTIDPGPDGIPDEAVLPADAVVVTVHRDDDPCTVDAATGSPGVRGRVVAEHTDGCVTAVGINGLEADDGTTFGPIEIEAPCD